MRTNAAIVLLLLGAMSPIVTAAFREVVHRHRARRDRFPATQDVALVGTLAGWGCFLAAGVCGVIAWVAG